MNQKDIVALVTGGASGLGEATVLELAARDAKVVIVDVDTVKGEHLASKAGSNVIFIPSDVTNEDDIRRVMDQAVGRFGKINVAVNCAGVPDAGKVLGRKGPMPLSLFNKVLQINLVGTMNVIRLAVERMVSNAPGEDGEKGVIVNTASIAAFDGQIGQAAYAASKGAIVGMTLPIARECADYGIRVVTIAPGLFETPLMDGMPLAVKESMAGSVPFPKRLGKPGEFAKMVLQVIENSMLNGCCIRLDGALRMPPK
ncbi:MAG: 3-hydroxyacyl-CoA dehydrogenase [Syntrophaceae bacterium]|jgi:3-hydroxyacyl-CoA dehydrogenase / 3-hydroxy-2-methylbutyryl-CoA dehydrogenase|nr:3-hydroxyacyl-CoA dehydrogenase [Syntrophaceae bacterium]HOC59204.1 3-hydroxyacyl-CoA dehydrogenase [Smithellaceae bacterium]HQM45260.1 3-hydroxyacyl-CoA dehydrogenase [Smithellaceae bacterium]